MTDALLAAEEVHRVYRLPRSSLLGPRAERHALAGVSLAVAAGETLGIVGESGSGKSTLARILLGLDRATSGVVTFDGRPVAPGRPHELRWFRRDMQIVFQDPLSSLDPRMTLGGSIEEPMQNADMARPERRRRVADLLDEVRLPAAFARRYPREVSGGQAQRVAIARALAVRPALIVLDEPTASLDVSIQGHIVNLLLELQARHGLTYLFVSHDLVVVRQLASRIAVMAGMSASVAGRTTWSRTVIDPPRASPLPVDRGGSRTP